MVVGASVGVSLALRLGPGVSDLVTEGSEMLGVAVRLGRASPEPPPQPVATARVSAASATMTGLAFFTAAPSSVGGQRLRVWRGTRTRASHAADEWPAHRRSPGGDRCHLAHVTVPGLPVTRATYPRSHRRGSLDRSSPGPAVHHHPDQGRTRCHP